MSRGSSKLPRSLDFVASGIATSTQKLSHQQHHQTPPLSPAVMRAAASSQKRFSSGNNTPRSSRSPKKTLGAVASTAATVTATAAAAAAEASLSTDFMASSKPHPMSPHLGRPISPRVLEAAAQSNHRRLTYKSSKDQLKIPPALTEEGPDDDESTSDDGSSGRVYSLAQMEAIRVAMGSRSSRMRQKYTIEPVPVKRGDHLHRGDGARGGDGGDGWRTHDAGQRGGGGGRWGHTDRGGAQQQQQSGPEREVADSDIDQTVPRQSGMIVFMPNAKYGFIRPDKAPPTQMGGQGKQGDYFFHATEIRNSAIVPHVGDVVTFQIARPSWSNRILAVRVEVTKSRGGSASSAAPVGTDFRSRVGRTGTGGAGWRDGGAASGPAPSRWGGTSRGAWRSGSRETTPSKQAPLRSRNSGSGSNNSTPSRSGYEGRVAVGPSSARKPAFSRRFGSHSDAEDNRSTGSSGSAGFEARRKAAAAAQAAAKATNSSSGGARELRKSPNRRSLNVRAVSAAAPQRGFNRSRSLQ